MCGRQVEKTVLEGALVKSASGELTPIKDIEVGDELACLETWEQAWSENGEVLEAHDIDLHDIREGSADQAHLDISSQNKKDSHE